MSSLGFVPIIPGGKGRSPLRRVLKMTKIWEIAKKVYGGFKKS